MTFMPGYVMHLAEAGQILEKVRERTEISRSWEQQFLTGTLLPDTRLKDEKRFSHFWNPEQLEQLALAPDLSLFLNKYRQRLSEPVILGYLAHLHLDACYVRDYWPTVIAFYGAQGEPEVRKDMITDVEMLHLHRKVPVNKFFSPEYYYGEYTKLNGYFIDKYHLAVPEWEQIRVFDMDEVRLRDMGRICRDLAYLLDMYHAGDEKDIQIFELDHLEAFMTAAADDFVSMYGDELAASAIEKIPSGHTTMPFGE